MFKFIFIWMDVSGILDVDITDISYHNQLYQYIYIYSCTNKHSWLVLLRLPVGFRKTQTHTSTL